MVCLRNLTAESVWSSRIFFFYCLRKNVAKTLNTGKGAVTPPIILDDD